MFPEAKERLVGYEVKFKIKNDFLPLVDPEFQHKTTLGTNPGPEQIAALQPDLVIMKGTVPMQIGESLRVLGVPVVYPGLETPSLFFKDLENLGHLFGNPARAREISNYYHHILDRIDKRLEKLQEEKRPRVLVP
jgi:iron complex transport system substrate-binding protein